ncbi:hypothetical protein [Rhodovulum adriaticum]|uniref:Uncharacterized protein n=1 Tax=Rhodovulum adriaticum TaxID=35804 RepID=A0A4R2NJF2_RHOAD|nr:hypothetical protein [Rhodovulum adriaticum]TCP21570.1 hypothetical protein EV656_11036 [Rhodovulum adriaticum]
MAGQGRWIWAVPALALAACSQFPEVDAAAPAYDVPPPYPRIAPLDQALARLPDTPIEEGAEAGTALAGRAAALRYRAAQLRARDF